jgi:hypothetical protein
LSNGHINGNCHWHEHPGHRVEIFLDVQPRVTALVLHSYVLHGYLQLIMICPQGAGIDDDAFDSALQPGIDCLRVAL